MPDHLSIVDEHRIQPEPAFVKQANLVDPDVHDKFSLEHFPGYFDEYAKLLEWQKPWSQTLDSSNPPFWRWFVGGELNASANCIDRHLAVHADKTAVFFVPEDERQLVKKISYAELHRRVNEFAAFLQEGCGLVAGDRVTLYMPMVVEFVVSILACTRIGVIHTQVFSGAAAKACADRIIDSGSRVLITADAFSFKGKKVGLFEQAKDAARLAKDGGKGVEHVLVWGRELGNAASTPGDDGDGVMQVHDHLGRYAGRLVEAVPFPSDTPLFLMYTSGTTGKPKGCQYGTGGFLAHIAWTAKNILDVHPIDVVWCMADIAWTTGNSYGLYGPLLLGASTVVFEGSPDHPDISRPWRIAEQLGVTIFYTSATMIRALRKEGGEMPARGGQRFKLMATVGEPIEPKVWQWYFDQVGKGHAALVDTWWQTETGGFLTSIAPAIDDMKPGSTGPAVPGIHPVIYDDEDNEFPVGAGKVGNICIRNPWPGCFQTIWNDPNKFVSKYFGKYNKDPKSKDWRDWPYFTSDIAYQAKDGYFRILGRLDDVIYVGGQSISPKEIEAAALIDPVAEAAAVAVTDPTKGGMGYHALDTVPVVFVSLKEGTKDDGGIAAAVSAAVTAKVGSAATPNRVFVVEDLPKTRSGKILRRLLAALVDHKDIGDISTLINPEVVEKIKTLVG